MSSEKFGMKPKTALKSPGLSYYLSSQALQCYWYVSMENAVTLKEYFVRWALFYQCTISVFSPPKRPYWKHGNEYCSKNLFRILFCHLKPYLMNPTYTEPVLGAEWITSEVFLFLTKTSFILKENIRRQDVISRGRRPARTPWGYGDFVCAKPHSPVMEKCKGCSL